MAIIYTTGTINQPDAGSVGLAMVERIRDDLTDHPAWELVEEFTPVSGTVRWYVLKCLAAESGLSDDFYVVISRVLGTGRLQFYIGEEYNSSGKIFSKFGTNTSATAVTFDSAGRHPDTAVLATSGFTGTGVTPFGVIFWTPSGTSTKWWLTVAEDGFTVAFNGAANGYVHVGGYTPLTDLEIGTPIQITGSSDTRGAVTRNPSVASGVSVGNALVIVTALVNLGFTSDLRYNDKLQNNQRPVAERGITLYQASAASAIDYGWVLGKQKRMRIGATMPSGFAFGDAFAMLGTLWVPYTPDVPQIWDTGVASS